MVRTHLEYGNVIWSPRYQSESKEVNKIQRRPTKLVPNLRSLPYEERLSSLKLPSLMHRRRGDMIQVYKITYDMDRIEPGLFFQRPQHTGTRGHSQRIYKQQFRLNVRRAFFSQSIVADWNSLPENVIMSASLNCFKPRLDRFWHYQQYKMP